MKKAALYPLPLHANTTHSYETMSGHFFFDPLTFPALTPPSPKGRGAAGRISIHTLYYLFLFKE